MENITIKKVILYEIAILSVILVIAGLGINTLAINPAEAEGLNVVLTDFYLVNGFDLLSFSFPSTMKTFYANVYTQATIDSMGAGLGTLSLLVLLAGIAALAVTIIFIIKNESLERYILYVVIGCTALSLIYTITYAIYVGIINHDLIDYYLANGKVVTKYTFVTYSWVIFLLQSVFLATYILCQRFLTDNAFSAEKSAISTLITYEQKIISVLKRYNGLLLDNVIDESEFALKKQALLTGINKQAKRKLKNVHISTAAQTEQDIIDLINDYKKLLDDNIITEDEFNDKKTTLLSYSIE